MGSLDYDKRPLKGLRTRVLRGRASVQAVIGAIAIAAVVLAFMFRPGQTDEAKPTPTALPAVKATATVAAVLPAPTVAAAVATATPQPAAAAGRTHTVAPGDTLTSIAQKYYSDASKFNKIFEANRDVLPTPDGLQVGQKLKIPD